jgi:hypothetical protein
MTEPFVNQLRARRDPVVMCDPAGAGVCLTIRVEMPEVWDTVKIVLAPEEPVVAMKVRALEALYPDGEFHEEFVLKLRGFEVLDESASIAATGAIEGSIFLLTHRHRRPVH